MSARASTIRSERQTTPLSELLREYHRIDDKLREISAWLSDQFTCERERQVRIAAEEVLDALSEVRNRIIGEIAECQAETIDDLADKADIAIGLLPDCGEQDFSARFASMLLQDIARYGLHSR